MFSLPLPQKTPILHVPLTPPPRAGLGVWNEPRTPELPNAGASVAAMVRHLPTWCHDHMMIDDHGVKMSAEEVWTPKFGT